jgi:sulfate/thiosulfate-binding protein
MRISLPWIAALLLLLAGALSGCGNPAASTSRSKGAVSLLNVSYDPTRELYENYNLAFARYWKAKSGQTVTIEQSHGGSGKQSQSVINGLPADVVTLGLSYDIDAIAKAGDVAPNWQTRLPDDSTPYTSTIVFLVRKGNAKHIGEWSDLVRPDVKVITPNPKTSSGGRWNYVAAWGYALGVSHGNQAAARDFVAHIYKNVPVLDPGARAATTTFERGTGDVLLAWENEALLAVSKLGADKYEVVVPSISILAEPPVAVVDKTVERKGTRPVAEAYLQYLYSPEGQAIIAHNFYRPRNTSSVNPADLRRFPALKLFTLKSVFGTWEQVQATHFRNGGVFDQIYRASR